MSAHDAIIIGAGIGGACAAISLAQRGARVLLLEAGSFPRHKVCGEFLSPESLAVFNRTGVLDDLIKSGARKVSAARIIAPNGSTLDTRFPVPGVSISRWKLDEMLWQRAGKAGVLCQSDRRVKKISRDGDHFLVQAGSEEFESMFVMDATGRSRLSMHQDVPAQNGELPEAPRFLGIKAHFQNARMDADLVELHFWRNGYCGLVRVEGDVFNLCLLARYDHRDAKYNAPARIWEKIRVACPRLDQRLQSATQVIPWQTTANVQFAARRPIDDDGVIRIGDAAGYIHPLTGDGMAMAARSGELAAAIVGAQLRGGLGVSDAAQLYEMAWRREFASRLKVGDALAKVLLSPLLSMPLMAVALMGVLEHLPRGAQKLVLATRGAIV